MEKTHHCDKAQCTIYNEYGEWEFPNEDGYDFVFIYCPWCGVKLDGTNDWISINDGLPDNGQEVIIYTEKVMSGMEFHKRSNGDEYFEDAEGYCKNLSDVTHWQPLPAPPK